MKRRQYSIASVARWTGAALLGGAIAMTGCRDVTSPAVRQVVPIYGIRVSPHAAALDTIWISFNLGTSACDSGAVVATEYTPTGMLFTASAIHSQSVCAFMPPGAGALAPIVAPLPRVFVIVPPHLTPFQAQFAEPGGADSVRTIGP